MNKLKIAISLTAVITLGGCSTFDPYTGEQKTSNTAKGAGIGASAAMLISYLKNKDASSSDRKKRLLKAAGIGAIAGGGAGYYMDTQEAKLRQQLGDSGVSVVRDGDNVNLIMPGNITFPSNAAALKDSFYEVLDSVALVLEEFEKTTIVVAGYTDSKGSESYNQKLSEQRAQSVVSYLTSRGVNSIRFEAVGFGEKNPIADNSTEQGRSQNRRVELTLLPITE